MANATFSFIESSYVKHKKERTKNIVMNIKKIMVASLAFIAGVTLATQSASAQTNRGTWKARTVAQIKEDLQTNDNGVSSYTVKWGDTLYAISLATDVSVDTLAKVNSIDDIRLIEIDTVLYFNEDKSIISVSTEEKVESYSVKSGQKVDTPQQNQEQIDKDKSSQTTKEDETTTTQQETQVTQQRTQETQQTQFTKTFMLYTLRQFMVKGVVNWNGMKFTYYSQSVLPGGGLRIPGRHVNEAGYVADKDGYIVLASDKPMGTIIDTPFGYKGKVYDRGVSGNHYDVYIR